jgi:Transposase IS116/IS110/IS902 family
LWVSAPSTIIDLVHLHLDWVDVRRTRLAGGAATLLICAGTQRQAPGSAVVGVKVWAHREVRVRGWRCGSCARAARFAGDAKLARAAGVAPIPVSSGKTNRHRLDRGGNRQINATIHRIALTRPRCHPETQDYIARKRAEGKTTKEAIRCRKRHLTRRLWHPLQTSGPAPSQTITPTISRPRSSDSSSASAIAAAGKPRRPVAGSRECGQVSSSRSPSRKR